MSLLSAAEKFAFFDKSAVVLDEKRCLHSKDRFSACELCYQICPSSAIQPGKPPILEKDLCSNCLACLPTCPVGAFHGKDDVQELLTCLTRMETKSVDLLCGQNPNKESGVIESSTGISLKGCLAGLGAGTYLTMISLGVEKIYVRLDHCKDCQWTKLQADVLEQVNQARNLISAWHKTESIVVIDELDQPHERPLWDAHNPPLSRRDLFRLAARQGKATLAQSVERDHSKDSAMPGRDRRRIINAMRQLPSAEGSILHPLGGTFAVVSVSEGCTACGTCARSCPTGAISFVTDDDETNFKLLFSPSICVGCELCAHVCLPSSITIDHSPTFQQVFQVGSEIVLYENQLAHCEVCKANYVATPGVYVCPTCENRRKNPFGSKLPPGFQANSKGIQGRKYV